MPWLRDRAPSQVAMAAAMADNCHGCLAPPSIANAMSPTAPGTTSQVAFTGSYPPRDVVVQIPILIRIRIHHPQARHLRPPMKRKRRLPRSRRRDNRNAKRTDTSTRLHHGNGHPIEQHVKTRNVRNSSTGLGTLWGTRLFGRAAVPESSTSSSSSSYGPPLAGGVGSYNHLW